MAASSSQDRPLMPGSFEPEDYIDDHANVLDDPFDHLTRHQDRWRERERPKPWASSHLADLDQESVEWRTYDPPVSLKVIPSVVSEVLHDIINSSVDTIREEAERETRRKQGEEERRKAAEAEAKEADKEQKNPDEHYLPIIIPEEKSETEEQEPIADGNSLSGDIGFDNPLKDKGRAASISSGTSSPEPELLPPIRGVRTRLAVLDRLFARSKRSGESSSAGFAREALRKQLEISAPLPGSFSHFGRSSERMAPLVGVAPEPLVPETTVECVSCLDDFPATSVVKVPCHSYCADCFVALISSAVQNEQQWPPKCCLNTIPTQTILRFVPEDLKNTFREKASEWEIPVNDRVYCYRAGCGLWIKPGQIKTSKRKGRCDAGHWTCILCRGKHHGSAECPQDPEMNLTNALAEEEGWKRCYKCHAYVEHREACQHMTCRCGAQFCYVCGTRWRNCHCTMEQLNAIKSQADERREQRQLKENAESEELRQILAQIEQFEREEALKAEIARQEEERLEQERQERELQRRAWEEYARRKAVGEKFARYHEELHELHDTQLAMVRTQQELDAINLCAYGQGAKEQLELKQQDERATLDASIQAMVAKKEKQFERDFNTRAGEEMKIMKEYEEKLRAYWINRPGGYLEVTKAMKPLRKKLEDGCKTWRQWKDEQLEVYKDKLEENRTIKEELMWHAARRLEEKRESDELDLVKRGVAEMAWVKLVSVEREKILQQMEANEMEGDADSLFAAENTGVEGMAARADDTGVAISCEPTTVGVAM